MYGFFDFFQQRFVRKTMDYMRTVNTLLADFSFGHSLVRKMHKHDGSL